MSESDTNNNQPLDHWSSDDLEADADTRSTEQRVADQESAFIRQCQTNAAQRIDARYNASTPRPSQELPHDAGTQSRMGMQANGDSQLGPTQNGADATVSCEIAPGGAGSSLDLTSERDRGLIRSSIARRPKRWAGVTDEVKAAVVAGLNKALGAAVKHIENGVEVLDAAKVVASVGKTFEALESQCQKDEHRAEDQERIDSGKATGAIKLYANEAPTHLV
jgi:hypothetical protein